MDETRQSRISIVLQTSQRGGSLVIQRTVQRNGLLDLGQSAPELVEMGSGREMSPARVSTLMANKGVKKKVNAVVWSNLKTEYHVWRQHVHLMSSGSSLHGAVVLKHVAQANGVVSSNAAMLITRDSTENYLNVSAPICSVQTCQPQSHAAKGLVGYRESVVSGHLGNGESVL